MGRVKPLCLIDAEIVLGVEHTNQISEYCDIAICHVNQCEPELLRRAEVLLLHSKLSSESLSKLTKCKYIGIRAHNLDYIDVQCARKMGIEVCGIEPVGGVSVAEHTFALIFALAKHLLLSHQNVLSGKWREALTPSIQLYNKHLGIMGHGAVGRRVAEIGRGIGMNILIHDPNQPAISVSLDDLLPVADVVTIHIPYCPENHHFMDHQKITKMKAGALLINAARGGLLDYDALEAALRDKKIAGAGIDVFEMEPSPLPNSLFDLPNVILSPHVAYFSKESSFEMDSQLIDNLIRRIQERDG